MLYATSLLTIITLTLIFENDEAVQVKRELSFIVQLSYPELTCEESCMIKKIEIWNRSFIPSHISHKKKTKACTKVASVCDLGQIDFLFDVVKVILLFS